jgi:TonB family protein
MGIWRTVTVACTTLLTVCAVAAPPSDEVRDAAVAMGYEAKSRCPDLLAADPQDATAALVLFVVGPTGVPSQASIKSSSGSASLDAAAVSCVLRLKFLPAVHAGDGNAMSSWQEIAWKWGRSHTAAASPAAAASVAAVAVTSPPPPAPAHPGAGAAEVRVCVDAAGRLAQEPAITRSSGDPALDAATLRVARSAAGSYPASGCLHLSLTAEDASAKDAR